MFILIHYALPPGSRQESPPILRFSANSAGNFFPKVLFCSKITAELKLRHHCDSLISFEERGRLPSQSACPARRLPSLLRVCRGIVHRLPVFLRIGRGSTEALRSPGQAFMTTMELSLQGRHFLQRPGSTPIDWRFVDRSAIHAEFVSLPLDIQGSWNYPAIISLSGNAIRWMVKHCNLSYPFYQ